MGCVKCSGISSENKFLYPRKHEHCFLYSCVCVYVHLSSLLLRLFLRPLVFFSLAPVSASTLSLLLRLCLYVHLFSLLLCLCLRPQLRPLGLYSCVSVYVHLFSLVLRRPVSASTLSLLLRLCLYVHLFSLLLPPVSASTWSLLLCQCLPPLVFFTLASVSAPFASLVRTWLYIVF